MRSTDISSGHSRRRNTVAIVGHTGSGKSTLVNLIPRLHGSHARRRVIWMTWTCAISIPEWLRRQIGFVPQETFLFSATLAENIAWGVDNATAGRHRARRGTRRSCARHRELPGRLRHHHRRARHHAIRRPEAARRHRARHPARSEDPDPRRCARQRRHAHRRAHPAKAWRA